jgi:hypothetical protein
MFPGKKNEGVDCVIPLVKFPPVYLDDITKPIPPDKLGQTNSADRSITLVAGKVCTRGEV